MLIAPLLTLALMAAGLTSPLTNPAWVAPIGPPTRFLRTFDRPTHNWLPGHRGVDLAASEGQIVRAAGSGRIIWAGAIVGRGVVVIAHAHGLRTTYEPVHGSVVIGQSVRTGEPIGFISAGQSHCGGPIWCLHWGLRRGVAYLNPMLLLKLGRPRLVPLADTG